MINAEVKCNRQETEQQKTVLWQYWCVYMKCQVLLGLLCLHVTTAKERL